MCIFAAVLQDLHSHLALSTAWLSCILHLKLLQTNDERPFTEKTYIQESEHCKAVFFASGNRREARHEETALIGDLFCNQSLWCKRATWFGRRKDDQCITLQACYLPADNRSSSCFWVAGDCFVSFSTWSTVFGEQRSTRGVLYARPFFIVIVVLKRTIRLVKTN